MGKTRQIIEIVVSIILATCAVILTWNISRNNQASAAPRGQRGGRIVSDWKLYAAGGHRRGTGNPRVVIVEFADFQCPYCAKARSVLDSLIKKYPSQITLAYHHFPLTAVHASAYDAALASECAALAGQFWEFHDAAFSAPHLVEASQWDSLVKGRMNGKNPELSECVHSRQLSGKVDADVALAEKFGIVATPTFLVNDRMIEGLPPLTVLEATVDSLLERS